MLETSRLSNLMLLQPSSPFLWSYRMPLLQHAAGSRLIYTWVSTALTNQCHYLVLSFVQNRLECIQNAPDSRFYREHSPSRARRPFVSTCQVALWPQLVFVGCSPASRSAARAGFALLLLLSRYQGGGNSCPHLLSYNFIMSVYKQCICFVGKCKCAYFGTANKNNNSGYIYFIFGYLMQYRHWWYGGLTHWRIDFLAIAHFYEYTYTTYGIFLNPILYLKCIQLGI